MTRLVKNRIWYLHKYLIYLTIRHVLYLKRLANFATNNFIQSYCPQYSWGCRLCVFSPRFIYLMYCIYEAIRITCNWSLYDDVMVHKIGPTAHGMNVPINKIIMYMRLQTKERDRCQLTQKKRQLLIEF